MKNREMLAVGDKPAPGDLAYIQGFVNLMQAVRRRPDLDGVHVVRTWMVRHGLLGISVRLGPSDLNTAYAFADSIRELLIAHTGGAVPPGPVKALNKLAARSHIAVVFSRDGVVTLQPAAGGLARALGELFAVITSASIDGSWPRLKACQNPECRWAFYDASKNHSGCWCAMSACGSRAKARAYRKRRSRQ